MKTKRFIATLICLAQTVLFSLSYAKDYYVKVDGTGDGSSWEKAMSGDDFAQLLPDVSSQSVFYIAAGNYDASAATTRSFLVNNSATIIGGFPKNPKRGDVANPNENITTFSAKKNTASPIFDVNEEHTVFKLKGVTIKDAYIGIYPRGINRISVSDCVFDNAPIIVSRSNEVFIENSSFKNLSAETTSISQFTIDSVSTFSLKGSVLSDIDAVFRVSKIVENLNIEDVVATVPGRFFDGRVYSANISRLKAHSGGLRMSSSSFSTCSISISESEIISNGANSEGIHILECPNFNLSKSLVKGYSTGVHANTKKSSLDCVEIYGGTDGYCFFAESSDVYINRSQLYDANEGVRLGEGRLEVENSVISRNSSYGIGPSRLRKLVLRNNIIGLNADATDKYGNGTGVFVKADSICIDGNIISGNKGLGVEFNCKGRFCEIKNNYIGTNKFYENLGNGGSGINLVYKGASYSTSMNPSSLKEANYIGFNGEDGVVAYSYESEISNNYIGVTPDGRPMPNGNYGINVIDGRATLNINNNHLGYNGEGDINSDYSVISHNIFHGNEKYAIKTTNDVPTMEITKEETDGFYVVVEGEVKSNNPTDVELYFSDGKKHSALSLLGVAETDANHKTFSIRFPLHNLKGTSYYSWVIIEDSIKSKFYGPQKSSIDLSKYQGKEYYVKVDGSGTKDGSSWGNAMSSDDFAKILPTVYDGSTFYLAEGSYQPCYCGDYEKCGGSSVYNINSSVKIIGGFSNNAKMGDENDPEKHPTIMNASYGGSSQHLFVGGDEPISLSLEGIIMKYATIAVLLSGNGKLYMNNCIVDSSSIITPNVETVEISNTKFSNVRKGASTYTYPLIIEKAEKVRLSNVSFSDIEGDIIYSNSKKTNFVCDSLIMKDVTVRNASGYLFAGDVNYGLFEGLDAETNGMYIFNSSDEIIIKDSKLVSTNLPEVNYSIYFANGKKLSVSHSSIIGYPYGILDYYSNAESLISLDDVTISCNKGNSSIALYLINGESDVVVNNSNLVDARYGVELVNANSLTVKNSMISGNSEYGVYAIPNSNANINLENNVIGLTRNADERYPNKVGVFVSANNFVAKNNVVSGNDSIGMCFYVVRNKFELSGNYIGTNRKFEDFGNGSTGIKLQAANVTALDMAPSTLASANYIGYNGGDGVYTSTGDLHSFSSIIRNNYIGVTPAGAKMPNKGYGISIGWYSIPYTTVSSELYIDHNHIGFNELGDIKEKGAYAVISKNVFHGNSVNAIDMDSRSFPSPRIYEVKEEDGKYVVYGTVSPDPRNSSAGVTVELYCTNKENESALIYIASVNVDENDHFSFLIDDMPEMDSEVSCLVAIAIYNEDPVAENHSYTTKLSDPYCLCTPAPVVVEKSVTVGTPFTIDNRRFYPKEEGYFEEMVTSEGEDGCVKKTIAKITVIPGEIPNAYYVKEKSSGDSTGSSWENAMSREQFTSICGSVPDGTTFFLAEGNYEPRRIYGYSGFYLSSDIRIIGGYPADAKTGAKRTEKTYSTIDASDMGVKSYLFRRMNNGDTLNIYLEGLKMMNVMNAIEATDGSKIEVFDCVFDNAPIVLSKVDSFSISNSEITNISEDSESPFPISIDSAGVISFRHIQFTDIADGLFKPTPYIDKLIMEDVTLNKVGGMLYRGKLGEANLSDVEAANASIRVEDISSKLNIEDSKLSHIELVIGNSFVLKNSTILGSGVDLASVKKATIENTTIDNQGKGTCLSSLTTDVTISGSTLKNGTVGYSYKLGSHTIKNCYIIGNTSDGINSSADYHTHSQSLELIGNYIGVGPSGKIDANGNGVYVNASAFVAKDNIISGNTDYGVKIGPNETSIIERNYIGTDEFHRDLGNGGCGIDLHGMSTMGGISMAPESIEDANVIGFNGGDGVIISPGNSALSAKISNNYIGVSRKGDPIPNRGYGISIVSGSFNYPVSIINNHIGYNEKGDVSEEIGSCISQNVFWGNKNGKAIENNTGYKTLEDNIPVIKEVGKVGDSVYVEVQVKDHFDADVELYETGLDPQSAKKLLAKSFVNYDEGGSVTFAVPVSNLEGGLYNYFVATAYYTGNKFTTELSSPYTFVKPLELGDYYVKENGSGDSTGASWENAMSAKQFASICGSVPDGTTFHLAEGNYEPRKIYGYSGFYLSSDIRVIGGYPADAETGAERTEGTYSTIDASDMGVKSYLFRRMTNGDTLNIYLEGLKMMNVMSAIEATEGGKIEVFDCVFDNAPIVLSKVESFSISNSEITNISEDSESQYPISINSAGVVSLKKVQFTDIADDLFKPTPYIDNLIMEDVTLNKVGGMLYNGNLGEGYLSDVKAANASIRVEDISSKLSIEDSKLSHIELVIGNSFVLKNSTILGSGVDLASVKKATIENTTIDNQGKGTCLSSLTTDVTVSGSTLKNGTVGYSYKLGNHTIKNCYIIGNTSDGINSSADYHTLSSSLELIGNHIGVGSSGEIDANGNGVYVNADAFVAKDNIISGNTGYGVKIGPNETSIIERNYIGTDESYRDLGNGGCGIDLRGMSTLSGIPMAPESIEDANVIGFNGEDGVIINPGNPALSAKICNNYIGVSRKGTPIPNKGYGIRIVSGSFNLPVSIINNHIGYNEKGDVSEEIGSSISQNVFWGNKNGKAIENNTGYKTLEGNIPVIKEARKVGDSVYVDVQVKDHFDADVELYETDRDPQSAKKLLAKSFVNYDEGGSVTFAVSVSDLEEGDCNYFVATAYYTGNQFTTELSSPYTFVKPLELRDYYVKENGSGDSTGSSWENAMSAKQFATYIPYAIDGVTFHMAAGNYTPLLTYGYGSYNVRSSIKVMGGYPSDAKTGAKSNPKENFTVMDGDPMPIKTYLFNSYGEALNIELEGIYMRNVMSAIEGGAGSVVIARNCEFSNAPIVLSKSDSLSLINCTIKDISESSEKTSPIVLDSLNSMVISSTSINNIYDGFCTYISPSHINTISIDNVNMSIGGFYDMGWINSAVVRNFDIVSQGIRVIMLNDSMLFEGGKISSSDTASLGLFVDTNGRTTLGDISLSIKEVTIEGYKDGVVSYVPKVSMDNVTIKGDQGGYCLYAVHSSDVIVSNSHISNCKRGIEVAGENLKIENSVISGNSEYGVKSYGTLNKIELYDNIIGLTKDESDVLANGVGVYVSADTFIAVGNLISANNSSGIQISNLTIPTTQSIIEKNYIGVRRDGSLSPNGGYGIEVMGGNRKDFLNISKNHIGGNEESDITVGNASSIISQNVFYGNKKLAIESVIESPIITSVILGNDKYVVNGEIASGLDKIKDGASVELFATYNEHQSALKYIASTSNVVDGKFSIEVPESLEEASCLVAIAIYNAESNAKDDKYSSELSNPYCLCELVPEVIEDTVLIGVYSEIFGDKYDPFIIGTVRDTIFAVVDGCQKMRVESFTVLPLDSTLTDYYVKTNGSGDGSSWENAMSAEVFAAYLPYAPTASTFHVAAGTYYPTLDLNLQKNENAASRFFFVRNDVSIIGGYPIDAKTGDVSDPDNNLTIFSGDILDNDSKGNTDDNTTYLFYIDKNAEKVRFDGVDIAHSRNGICTDLAPQSSIVVSHSRMNNCDAAVRVTLVLSSLELDNVKFDSNVHAVSSGSISNTTIKNSSFVHHTGVPLWIMSSGKVSVTNSIFDENLSLPIVQCNTSDVTITSSTFSNSISQGEDEPIIQSSIVKLVNNTFVDNEQGGDWIKADSLAMYHNTLLGIKGLVGGMYANSDPAFTFVGNIFGYDSLPSEVSEILPDNIVGLTKGGLSQNVDERLLSVEQLDLLFYKEEGKFLLTNRGGFTPVVALRTDVMKNGESIRLKNSGIEVDQRGEMRPDMTCMGAYEYLAPVIVKLSDSICFGETIYQKHGFDIVLEGSISGVFDFDRVVTTGRVDTFYQLALTVKPQPEFIDVKITPSTCINNPNGELSFGVEGWIESIAYMSYEGEEANVLLPFEVIDAVAKFRINNLRDKSFTLYVENKCGSKIVEKYELDAIPNYSISISDNSTTDLRCSYSKDGFVEVVISGGHELSEFSMRGGMTIARKNDPSVPETIVIDNLGSGIYTFSCHSTVDGCSDEVIASHKINAPEPIVFKNCVADATCYGVASGELDIVPLRNGEDIHFVDENKSVNYARDVFENNRTDKGYLGKFGDIDSIGFSLVSLDPDVYMYGKTQDQFFNDALQDAVDLGFPMDSLSLHDSLYTKFQYPQSWLGYTAMYPGIYRIEVRDSKGCYFEQSYEIKNPKNPLSVKMVEHAIDACDADKRRVKLKASGGWAPYQFIVVDSHEWGDPDENDHKDLSGNQGSVTVGQDFEPDTMLVKEGDSYVYTSDILPVGKINIMVMDKKGCVDTIGKNMIVDANIKVVGEEVFDKCAQPKNHSIKVNLGPEISKKPHTYKIRLAKKGDFLEIKDFQTDEEGNDIISGLPSGRVGVFAYADGCSGYSTVDIAGDTSLSYIPYVAVKLDSIKPCPDAATGELEIKVYGSYPPYQMYLDDFSDASLFRNIDLYDTVTKAYAQISDPSSFESTVNDKLRLRSLPGGAHTLVIVDKEGCKKNVDYNFGVSSPIVISAAASPVCPGEEFSRVYVESVSGGTAPYLYALDDSYDFNDESFKKVSSGTSHSISVKDANGCVKKSGVIPPNTEKMSNVNVDCMVTNWHSLDDIVVFVDISSTVGFTYDSVSFSIKPEDLPQGVSYEVIDPDYFRYGLMPGDTVEWINGKTYYGPLWGIPDEVVSSILPENEYDREYKRLEQVVEELEKSLNSANSEEKEVIKQNIASQTEKLKSICTKEMALEKFTAELFSKNSIERMKFIRLVTDSLIQNSGDTLFSYPFTHTLYVGGCDITVEYNGENGRKPNNVENEGQHFANLNTKDILELIASPNPANVGDECTIFVTLKSKKDVYCDVYGLNGSVSAISVSPITANSDEWESSDSNYMCKFNVNLTETSIVRVRTATDAASVVVLVNPSER